MPKGFYVHLETPRGLERWHVTYKRLGNKYGQTDWAKHKIEIDPSQTTKEHVDTLAHEVIHVTTDLGHEDKVEEVIRRVAAGITETLFKAKLIVPEEE